MRFSSTGRSFARSAQSAQAVYSPSVIVGFVKGQRQSRFPRTSSGGASSVRRQPRAFSAFTGSSSVEEKVAALRAAADKAREDADRWSRHADRLSRVRFNQCMAPAFLSRLISNASSLSCALSRPFLQPTGTWQDAFIIIIIIFFFFFFESISRIILRTAQKGS
jgi:hypothetical protein